MDSLLATYASDDDDEQDEEEENNHEEKPQLDLKPPLFGRLPPPRNPTSGASSHSFLSSLPPPRCLVKSEEVIVNSGEVADQAVRPGLFSKLPAPKAGANPNGEGLGFGAKPSSLFAALPPPKVKVEAGAEVKVKKPVVAFKPPIDVSALADDGDDWRPAQKRVKAEAGGGVVGGGGGLQALLPAPKNSLGSGSALGGGGRRAAMDVSTRTEDVKAVNSGVKAESQGRAVYDNAAYAVDESAAFAPQDCVNQVAYSNEAYGWTAPAEEIPQSVHDVNSHYEQYNTGNASYSSEASHEPANSAPVSDPLAQVLQAQRRRGREDKMAAPTVIEVKQADLTGGNVREDKLRATGIAFGPAYKPVSSTKDKSSKLQRRKHQIGTLLHDMKAREMELMDRRARGSLTKAETQAKYGW